MAPLAVVFDGLTLHTDNTGVFQVRDEIGLGTQEIVDFFQGLRQEEFDQAAAEERLTRTVTIPLRIRSATVDAAITNQKSILSRIAGASRYTPKTLTITPAGASTTSTFKVYGGSFESSYTQSFNVSLRDDATLVLHCDWPIYGVTESLGSAGSPLVSNTNSPVNVTLTPTIAGDVPADVTLYVKNRHGTLSGRGLMVGTVSGNTTWSPLVDSNVWTGDADGTSDVSFESALNSHFMKKSGTVGANAVYKVAHWTVPTLPTDRRFTTWLRVKDATSGGAPPNNRGTLQFRLRHTSGQIEVIGEWRSIPEEALDIAWHGVEMGTWPYPLGNISSAGAAQTTTYIEVLGLQDISGAAGIGFDYVFYLPEDSSIVVETSDTSKTLVGPAGTCRVEIDQVYTSGGIPAGAVEKGTHIRARGTSRFVVHLSAGFLGTIDPLFYWDYLPVDVYAEYTPRFLHLA